MINKTTFPKRLACGAYIDLNDFTEDDVDIEDINISLNQIKRFGGHYKDRPPLTVAQHTWLVMAIADREYPDEESVRFNCLLHDFPEAYYGDIVTPIKHRLKGSPIFRSFIDSIDTAVYNKLWKPKYTLDDEVSFKTKVCDLVALDIERRSLWNSQIGKTMWPEIPDLGLSMREKQAYFEAASEYSNTLISVDLVGLYNSF